MDVRVLNTACWRGIDTHALRRTHTRKATGDRWLYDGCHPLEEMAEVQAVSGIELTRWKLQSMDMWKF